MRLLTRNIIGVLYKIIGVLVYSPFNNWAFFYFQIFRRESIVSNNYFNFLGFFFLDKKMTDSTNWRWCLFLSGIVSHSFSIERSLWSHWNRMIRIFIVKDLIINLFFFIIISGPNYTHRNCRDSIALLIFRLRFKDFNWCFKWFLQERDRL